MLTVKANLPSSRLKTLLRSGTVYIEMHTKSTGWLAVHFGFKNVIVVWKPQGEPASNSTYKKATLPKKIFWELYRHLRADNRYARRRIEYMMDNLLKPEHLTRGTIIEKIEINNFRALRTAAMKDWFF